MKEYHNRLSKLESRVPVPHVEPEERHEAFIEWAGSLPNGPAIIDCYRDLVARGIDTLGPPTREHRALIGLLIDALPFLCSSPQHNAMVDEFHREHERQMRYRASRRR
jgi:hypothetical protein